MGSSFRWIALVSMNRNVFYRNRSIDVIDASPIFTATGAYRNPSRSKILRLLLPTAPMAEAIGLAASIFALLETSKTILDFVKGVRDSKQDVLALREELGQLRMVARMLGNRMNNNDVDPSWRKAINELNKPLNQLDSRLKEIFTPERRARDMLDRVRWTFNKKEIDEIMLRIHRMISVIALALEDNMLYEIFLFRYSEAHRL